MTLQEILKKSEEDYRFNFGAHGGSWLFEQSILFNRTLARNIVQAVIDGLPETPEVTEELMETVIDAECYVHGFHDCRNLIKSHLQEMLEGGEKYEK